MELIRGHYNLRPRHRGCVATIGNFDGLHLGHQAILARLVAKSHEYDLPSVVITFEPHPQEYFQLGNQQRLARLTSFREKFEVLAELPIDRVLCLPFNRGLAEMTAADFIDRVLVGALGLRALVIGDDFRFGARRQGDIATLRAAGEQHGFEVVVVDALESGGSRASSTRIREALRSGDLAEAERMLGRPYRLDGLVVAGDGLGRQLGFPTANVYLQRRSFGSGAGTHQAPLAGVFAVRVLGIANQALPGVANIGTRPTVDGTECRLEVHVLDFKGDLYGRHLRVEFHARLREERRFASLGALVAQIERDVRAAREWFASK
ncbi:MAG: bifunctional riboflavin kinase/FAD synthetase [Chromatiales bacterium]|jgi:riboflavin kinase/FMN adenylyltransferase|nr:bifunctional riboflavin kinase/FAD synthetase [Chromatiales bacterium]